jgi:hypothetical protein
MLSSWFRCSRGAVLGVDLSLAGWVYCTALGSLRDILVAGRPLAFGLLAVSSAGRMAGGSESILGKMYCSFRCNSIYRFVLTSLYSCMAGLW